MDSGMCCCGSNVKGKGREVVPVEEDIPDVLGSPINLLPTISTGSSSSYLVLPIANESSSAVVEESLVSPLVLVNDEDKENVELPGAGAVITFNRLGVLQGSSMGAREFVQETRAILQDHSEDIVMVRGQCAFRSQGPPKSQFNPYTSIHRHLRPGRQFLFRPSHSYCHVGLTDDKLSSV